MILNQGGWKSHNYCYNQQH